MLLHYLVKYLAGGFQPIMTTVPIYWFIVTVARLSGNWTPIYVVVILSPRAGSGAVSKWVICACDSLVDFGTV